MNKQVAAREKTRANILSAARQVFSERGYEGTNFRTLSELCGAKRSLIIYHFSSKEALWKEMVLQVKNDYQAAFNQYYCEVDLQTDEAMCRHSAVAFLKAARHVPEYGRILILEGLTANDRLKWLNTAMVPDQISTPPFKGLDYAQASYTGLVSHIQAGALLYIGNMGPLMNVATDDNTFSVSPLTDETIEKIADYLLLMVNARIKEITS